MNLPVSWRRREPGAPPLIIGHRGASAHETENTLAAFRRARRDGADGVELDVHLCRSGEVVVFHDDDLKRLAGRPERVAELALAALREARVGGAPIPTLDETLEELGPMIVNIELKCGRLPPRRLAPAVADRVRAHGLGPRALVSSFNPLALAHLRAAAPEVPRALLFYSKQSLPFRRAWPRAALAPVALHPEHVLATAERVARWHVAGYAVNCWTVDDPDVMRRLDRAGVDGLITNDPGRTRELLRQDFRRA